MLARLRSRAQEEKGFTLIELLVVVLIIGILAAIAIPAFLGQKKSAQDASAKSILRNAATAAESVYVDKQAFGLQADLITDLQASEPGLVFISAAPTTATPEQIQVLVGGGTTATTTNNFVLNAYSKSGKPFSWGRDFEGKTTKCKNLNTAPAGATAAITGCTGGTW